MRSITCDGLDRKGEGYDELKETTNALLIIRRLLQFVVPFCFDIRWPLAGFDQVL